MSLAIITGSTGLVGSESVNFFHDKGFDVIGIDNNFRSFSLVIQDLLIGLNLNF